MRAYANQNEFLNGIGLSDFPAELRARMEDALRRAGSQDGLTPEQANDPLFLLREIRAALKKLVGEYVTPKLVKSRRQALAVSTTGLPFKSDNVPVHRILLQVFAGTVDFHLAENVDDTSIPDFRLDSDDGLKIVPYPGLPVTITPRNDDAATAASYSIILMSAAG